MSWLNERMITVFAVVLVAFAITPPDTSTAVLAGVAVIAIGLTLAAAHTAVLTVATVVTIGDRARQHRQLLSAAPAPLHPDTAGRPRPRAPSRSPMVA